MKLRALVVAAAAFTAFGAPASAQDTALTATYGEISLSSGFTPDPRRVSMTAGGSIDASALGSPCTGSIARAPDFQLYYSAGSLPLIFSVEATSDTTLVINGPDNQWYCDDDSGGESNPRLRWGSPPTGTYDIWVGTYSGGTAPATLVISELDGGDDEPEDGYPNSGLRAAYGEVNLSSGFTPDPHRISLTAGGSIEASVVSSSCRGSIAEAPDYQVTFTSGSLPLTFRTQSGVDTTLVINGPDGQWHCDDDSGGGTNASVTFAKPSSGVYDIWVGTYSGGTNPATLIVTELD